MFVKFNGTVDTFTKMFLDSRGRPCILLNEKAVRISSEQSTFITRALFEKAFAVDIDNMSVEKEVKRAVKKSTRKVSDVTSNA